MKLQDLGLGVMAKADGVMSRQFPRRPVSESNAVRYEVEELMRADIAGLVANCPLLAGDEIELADAILSKLSDSPDYVPSPLVIDFIRGINARVHMSSKGLSH